MSPRGWFPRRRNRRVDRSRREARRHRLKAVTKTGIALVLLGFGLWQLARLAEARDWLDLFRVREVTVVGAEVAHPAVLVAEAGLMGAELHWWSELGDYVERVERDPLVAEATFHRRFPNRLRLEIVEREPIAFLDADRLTPVDSVGRVLPVDPYHTDWNAPILKLERAGRARPREGKLPPGAARRTLSILGEISRRYPALSREISAVELDRVGTLTLRLVHEEGAIVLDVTTPVEKLALIDDVLRDLEEKGLGYRVVDLRFDDQIVVRRG
ncbi:MAG: FtsQ-type POTRA domain-containing protein [Gemmatimonadota bacterium]|nr:FtsQ-type POTRA domain-containing protein [Gemmatimonadota bacterium]